MISEDDSKLLLAKVMHLMDHENSADKIDLRVLDAITEIADQVTYNSFDQDIASNYYNN